MINFAENCPDECHVEVDCNDITPDPNDRPFDVNPMCEPWMRSVLKMPPLEECQCRDGYLRDGEELFAELFIEYDTSMCIKINSEECQNGCVDTEGNIIRVRCILF